MTLKLMEGFDAVRDDTDLTARGWVRSTAALTTNGVGVLGCPTKSGAIAGFGLRLRGPYNAGTSTPFGAAARADFGMLNTGQSVNSLWNAGGFALGANVTFNSGTQVQVAPSNTQCIAYDGTQYYWAILYTGSGPTFSVGYSTDLINWTVTATQPTTLKLASGIAISGTGSSATVIITTTPYNLTANQSTFQYTSNMGASWSTSTATFSGVHMIMPTGNATTPYLVSAWDGASSDVLYSLTAINSAATRVGTLVLGPTSGSSLATLARKVGNILMICSWDNYTNSNAGPTAVQCWWYGVDVTQSLTTQANYIKSTTFSAALQNDITFFNNKWLSCGYGGIYSAPNSATSPAIAPPTAAWTTVLNTNTTVVYGIDCNSTIAVAVGQDPTNTGTGAIWTSTDGTTWTKNNRLILSNSSGTGYSNGLINVRWDGTRFFVVGGINANVIATSPDGLNWTPIYYPDYTETTQGASGFGFYSGTVTSGVFTPWSTLSSVIQGVSLSVAALSSGSRVLAGGICAGDGTYSVSTAPQVTQSMASTTHYIELIATAVAGTPNLFSYQFAIDGVVQATPITYSGGVTQQQLAASSDTTGVSKLFISLPRSGQIVQVDDMYLATKNGTINVAPLGLCAILPHSPTGDVQKQWTPSSGTSNAAVATANALSNAGTNAVTTNVDGAKDIYSCNTIAGNNMVLAVAVEAFVSETAGTPSVTVGIVSGGSESDSAVVTPNTATPLLASTFSETDPATGLKWTVSAASASTIALNKIS